MILKNLVYILQSEHYFFKRFLKFVYTHVTWWKFEQRQKIVWTTKARALWIMSACLFFSMASLFFLFFNTLGLLAIPFLILVLPFFVGMSLWILAPLDNTMKQKKVNTATKIISESNIIVIGIAGSYGKTSTKEILATILRQKFNIIKTPENTNTDIGIAQFIIDNKNAFKDGSVFIVEMGAYKKGEIAKICKMVHPTYSILTGINEAHLERFGNLENTIQAKFELPQNTEDLVILNFDDENIRKNYEKFSLKKVIGISKQNARSINVKPNFAGLEFEWQGMKLETSLLAEHNITLILLCTRMALEFSMTMDDICKEVKDVGPVAHRLQPIYNANRDIMVIDDSYNGNYAGIVSGLELLSRVAGRKVVLTPGLVELGSKTEVMHEKIGTLYAQSADVVLLIRNKMTDAIIKGLEKNNYTNYKVYNTTEAAHADLQNVLKQGDTVIFQNDLTDNYF